MDVSNDLVRGSVVPIVMALLHERPMYGYEMVKLVNARSNGLLEWREGTLYPALHQLEADRLIASKWQAASQTGKPRKYYRLSRKGTAELARRRSEWEQFANAVDGLLMGG